MFISALELFKTGIGPSSSHTMGPMSAARAFIAGPAQQALEHHEGENSLFRCTLRGSLAFTGKGHATDRAVILGAHGYAPADLIDCDVARLAETLGATTSLLDGAVRFEPAEHIIFDRGPPLPQHPNGMIFELLSPNGETLASETYFSIGGGFINTLAEIEKLQAPLPTHPMGDCPYPFDSAVRMLEMASESGLSIAAMKRANEIGCQKSDDLDGGLDRIWQAMRRCIDNGLNADGILPGGLEIARRARKLHEQLLRQPNDLTVNEWLCAYAMAVNEENAAGHPVVTAPTNGAAGVIPAVIRHWLTHEGGSAEKVRDFLLTAAAVGGLIKHNSSISGAEVGCQGEVGAASAMAAAGLCQVKGGTPQQVEKAAEMALEHHLGMTCDPVAGLVQAPCIERNGFGAVKAHIAAALALREGGDHFMSLDACIRAMKQTGEEMSANFKETSQGGLAVSRVEC